MVFSSVSFLYFFLPLTMAAYFIVPRRAKNAVLLISSLVFYFYGEQVYILIMLAQTVISYVFSLLIEKFRGRGASKAFMIVSVSASVLMLGFFKYSEFFAESVGGALGISVAVPAVALPMGISFYTFQTISYIADVYSGRVAAQRNLFSLALYISLFPQLIAGPIVRYSDVEKDIYARTHTVSKFAGGAFRFVIGLAKKVMIADRLFEFCTSYRESGDSSVIFAWAYAAAYLMYVYFDFSGYSDMAIGLGGIFGFSFPENFDHPLESKSVTEFWRRWHITLGAWFRDYVYIPLGGNRAGVIRHAMNLAVVWLLTGLWHGASWNYVLWGAYFGLFLIIEKLLLRSVSIRLPRALGHVYLLVCAVFGFVFFGADSVPQAIETIGRMFGVGAPLFSAETRYYISSYALVLAAAAIGSTSLPKRIAEKIGDKAPSLVCAARPMILAALLIVISAYFADGSFSPFLYFRF